MQNFDDQMHTMVQSSDGSYTAYSKQYEEHYHSTKDGALQESLFKHVIPALDIKKDQGEIILLDICFGLGFNTLATLYYKELKGLNTKLKIYSPELDAQLIESLRNFEYPKEFQKYKTIIEELIEKGFYKDAQISIELFVGDAREYVQRFDKVFDVVYQDAFSPASNPLLWTKEYFNDIAQAMKNDGLLTTYSTALATRLALYENGFVIYLNKGEGYRNSTLATLGSLEKYEVVDMKHKIACNPDAKPLYDTYKP